MVSTCLLLSLIMVGTRSSECQFQFPMIDLILSVLNIFEKLLKVCFVFADCILAPGFHILLLWALSVVLSPFIL